VPLLQYRARRLGSLRYSTTGFQPVSPITHNSGTNQKKAHLSITVMIWNWAGARWLKLKIENAKLKIILHRLTVCKRFFFMSGKLNIIFNLPFAIYNLTLYWTAGFQPAPR
jgi:hypothetical protein